MKINATKKSAAVKVVAKSTRRAAAAKTEPKAAKQAVTFSVHADKGKAVYLAGEFNNWDPAGKKMAWKARSGIYTATLQLAPGVYQYKFVIDGVWCADPENENSVQNDQGTFNSVVTVG
ncbi:MAG: glycogen-binding domain-containing protein [Kiritimatiellae bacterium]|nr:glycogen-binding domain-containing protein [Kiritimatiellia bacterium]